MSEISSAHGSARKASLTKIGGAMGITGCIIGLGIFVAACAGIDAMLALAVIPLVLGVAGLATAVAGALCHKSVGLNDPQILAAMWVGLISALGGLLLLALKLNWTMVWHSVAK